MLHNSAKDPKAGHERPSQKNTPAVSSHRGPRGSMDIIVPISTTFQSFVARLKVSTPRLGTGQIYDSFPMLTS